MNLIQTHLSGDLKASAHFATEVLKQVTVSSHLQPHHPSKREATCLYTPSDRLAERHNRPQSHTPSSPDPPAAVSGQQSSSMMLCRSRTVCSPCPSGHLQKTLKHFSHAMFYAVHLLPLARANSGRNDLFPAQEESGAFKCSSLFTVSSCNNFKTCYSTVFVPDLITTQLYS